MTLNGALDLIIYGVAGFRIMISRLTDTTGIYDPALVIQKERLVFGKFYELRRALVLFA